MRAFAALATFVAGCALALVVAFWGWRIFGPAPVHIASPAPRDPVATIVAADLFGGTPAASQPEVAQAALPGDARLLGVIATPSQHGYALFRLASGPKLVAQGQEIVSGVTLAAIEPFSVTIREGGRERRFRLHDDKSPSAADPNRPAPVRTSSISRTATCAPPADFHGNVVRVNAELLGSLSGDAGPWRALLGSAGGSLVVREDGGFAAMLGLRAGDRILQANGIALRVPDDVASAVVRPLVANQGVRIVGSRAGSKQELWLANIACAG
jgi:type II secretory pathway component PulC